MWDKNYKGKSKFNKEGRNTNQRLRLPQDIRSTVVESWTCRGHNLSSGQCNHENFIPLKIYFDEEYNGIGFKGWKWLNVSHKLKYQPDSFLIDLFDNLTSRAHILRFESQIWEKFM
jgi:hypothetical protein